LSAHPLSYQNGTYKYDFSIDSSQVYGGTAGCKLLAPNIWGMPAGDVNADGSVNEQDKTQWGYQAGNSSYTFGDLNLDGQVNNLDVNDYWILNYPFNSQVP
jgi:hypothetical protein